jgi:hypothetical protein
MSLPSVVLTGASGFVGRRAGVEDHPNVSFTGLEHPEYMRTTVTGLRNVCDQAPQTFRRTLDAR